MSKRKKRQMQAVTDRLEDMSACLHGVVGVLTSISCMYSSNVDIPDTEYMHAAIYWLAQQVEQCEKELDGIILPAFIPCYQEQTQA